MLTLEQISDRLELERLVVDCSNAVDERAFDRLDAIFAADAYIDSRTLRGIDGTYPIYKAWLMQEIEAFPAYMHLVGNFTFDVCGDEATGKVACFNPLTFQNPQGGMDTMFLIYWNHDHYRRTADGWRIRERIARPSCNANIPDWLKKAMQQ